MSNENELLTPAEETVPEKQAASPLPTAPPDAPETASSATPAAPEAEDPEQTLQEDAFLTALFSDTSAAPQETEPTQDQGRQPWLQRFAALWGNKRFLLFLAAALFIVGIVCVSLFGGARLSSSVLRLLRYSGDQTEFSFDAHNSNSYRSFHNGLAVASASGLMCLDKNGEETALLQNQMDLPVLLENGTHAMSYGVGSSSICRAHYKKGADLELTVPGILIDADLSEDSCIGYATQQTGYKTVLTVLDAAGTEIYRWFSSTRFFHQCAVSKAAKTMAAISLGQTNSSFSSTCVLFETDQEQPVAELSLGDDLIYELSFLTENRLCAVGEEALHFFDADGSGHSQYSYEGGTLLNYNLNAEDFCVILRDMNRTGGRYRLSTVRSDGTELAALSLEDEILDISAKGHYLAVLTSDRVQVFDSRLRLCLEEENTGFATQACVQSDGAVLLINGSTARRVS